MAARQQPTFVDSEVLKTLVEDKTKIPGKDYLVVDVRDQDYVGGHIPGGVNIPSSELPERLPSLIEEYKDIPQLFFHCALSQVRGPKAANRYSDAVAARDEALLATQVEAVASSETPKSRQQINILRGGFGEWQRKHKDSKILVEAYEPEYWTEDSY